MTSSSWRLNYFIAIVNGDLAKIKELAAVHGVNVRLTADSCQTCSFIESNLSVKPSLSSDEIESYKDCLSLSDNWGNADHAGCRPLHVACGHGLIDIASFLLANSADVHVRTILKPQTPLQLAVCVSSELCAILMKAGADLDVTDPYDGRTPLDVAISDGSLEDVTALLSARLQYPDSVARALSTLNDDGELPLHCAVHVRSAEITQLLIDAGTEVNARNVRGTLPLLIAVGYNDTACARVLLQKNNLKSSLSAALCHATHHGNYELITMLLDAGANPDSCFNESTPLMSATFYSRIDIVQLLLSRGAQIDNTNSTGYTALHFAAWDGIVSVVDLFLKAGAQDDLRTSDGNTPLALACHGGHSEVAAVFISRSCNVNNADRDFDTPLLYSSFKGDFDSVRLLVNHGANACAKNRVNATPIWNAVYGGHFEIFKFLLLAGNPPLSIASRGLNQNSGGAQAQLIYEVERTPLYVALDRGHFNIAAELLKSGVQMRDESWYWKGEKSDIIDTVWMDKLSLAAQNAPSLMQSVRDYLRQLLGSNVLVAVPQFDIPRTLQEYLLLRRH